MPSNLTDDPELEAALVRAVAYGLRKVSALKPKDRGGPDPRDIAARAVVDHLKLSNWIITKGEPLKGHRIP